MTINTDKQEAIKIFNISYYFSYKEWVYQKGLQYWPGYICLLITLLQGILSGGTDATFYLLCFSLFVLLFCVVVTRFHSNAVLEITRSGIIVTKNRKIAVFHWADISDIAVLVPSHGASYLEMILVINTTNDEINYIFIESLYFNTAKNRAGQIGAKIEEYIKDYTFKIELPWRAQNVPLCNRKGHF